MIIIGENACIDKYNLLIGYKEEKE